MEYNILYTQYTCLWRKRVGFGCIECFTTTFLQTNSWLNSADEDEWWRWGWPVRKARRHQKITSKWDPKHRECGQRTWFNFAIIGNCRIGNIHGQCSLEGPRRRLDPYPRGRLFVSKLQSKLLLFNPVMPGRQIIIDNWPPSRPHFVTNYDIQSEGCQLLSKSSTGTIFLNLRPEAEHTLTCLSLDECTSFIIYMLKLHFYFKIIITAQLI